MDSSHRLKQQQQQLRELEKQYSKLLSKVSALSVAHCSLSHKNSLVAVLCDSLLHVQPLASGQQHWQEQRLTELLEAEGQLLQTLGCIPAVPIDQHLELLREASVDGQEHPSISLAEDPMQLLKLFTQRPLVENADRCGMAVSLDLLAADMQLFPASCRRQPGCWPHCRLGTRSHTPSLLLRSSVPVQAHRNGHDTAVQAHGAGTGSAPAAAGCRHAGA